MNIDVIAREIARSLIAEKQQHPHPILGVSTAAGDGPRCRGDR
jgi:hypothetical protein